MRRLAALAALLLAACSKPAPSPAHVEKGRLEQALDGVPSTPPCSRVIPLHWSPSLPVPVREGGAPAYRIFFYGRDGSPPNFVFHQAEGDATFRPDGAVVSCAQRPGHGATITSDPSRWKSLSVDEFAARESRLYAEAEAVAELYFSSRAPSPGEKKRIAAFSTEFFFLSEPGHAPAYRALNPDFWSWVDQNSK